ncbi:hypothetical protein [Baekduia sp. Peel2402]|uniref:hypothetical protein n=1 Tax=Baekduia sp. Peel2402 TaxID=3458296 RepID=UPI00403EA045
MGTALGASERTSAAAQRESRLTWPGVVVAVAVLLLLAFYAWTASSAGDPFNKVNQYNFSSGGSDYYNLQADAFLHGRLWLDVPIDPKLKSAANPYLVDVPRTVKGLPDGSFYNGRYYMSWGPAPAVTTFLPPRLLGLELRENLAVVLYLFFGVLMAGATLRLLLRRVVPSAPRAVLWAGTVALALASSAPWILRRAIVYEVAISAAFFFMMAGLLLLVRELLREQEEPRRGRLAWVGVLFGLAVLSRPSMGFVVLGLTGLGWVLRPRALRTLAPLVVGIPIAAGLLFMVYNMARFSGPLDFGNKWQTTGRDVREIPFNSLANLPPALWGYLVGPVRLMLDFPYVHLPVEPRAPFSVSSDYGQEETGSVLWAVPFALLSVAFLARVWWRRRRANASGGERDERDVAERPVLRVVVALMATAVLAFVPVSIGVPGYTERYELDFLPYLIIAATLGWAALVVDASTRRRAAWWRRGGLVLAAWSVLVGVAISFTGYYDGLRTFKPNTFEKLEKAFSPLPTLATVVTGRPMIATLGGPEGYTNGGTKVTKIDLDGATYPLQATGALTGTVTVVSPSEREAELAFRASTRTQGTFSLSAETEAGTTAVLVGDESTDPLPLRLKRGINYVNLVLTAGPDVQATADGSPPRVVLADLRLR